MPSPPADLSSTLFSIVIVMRNLLCKAKRFVADDRAAEVTELGIVLALIVAGAVVTIALIGPKIQKAYTDTNASLP
jgi:Flp pilus assembly pilin Flp